jgi:DNA repair protein RAD5
MEERTEKPPKEALFLQDSSDEDDEQTQESAAPNGQNKSSADVPIAIGSAIKNSDVSSTKSNQLPTRQRKREFARVETLSDDSDDDIVMLSSPGAGSKPIKLKRKASPASASKATGSNNPISLTPGAAKLAAFERGYIGSFYCSGLSLNKGKGYISNGSKVLVVRNKTQEEKDLEKAQKEAARAKTSGNGKAMTVIKNGKVITGGAVKQSILALGKKSGVGASSKPVKKVDTIIRFNNERGFEVGRLPAGDAAFISPLLDPGMIELEGIVEKAPVSLTVGCDILLDVKVYLTKKAFEESILSTAKSKEEERSRAGGFWQQQGETEEERRMSLRKSALDKLFSKLSTGSPIPLRYSFEVIFTR